MDLGTSHDPWAGNLSTRLLYVTLCGAALEADSEVAASEECGRKMGSISDRPDLAFKMLQSTCIGLLPAPI